MSACCAGLWYSRVAGTAEALAVARLDQHLVGARGPRRAPPGAGRRRSARPPRSALRARSRLRRVFPLRCLRCAARRPRAAPACPWSTPGWVVGRLEARRRERGREVALDLPAGIDDQQRRATPAGDGPQGPQRGLGGVAALSQQHRPERRVQEASRRRAQQLRAAAGPRQAPDDGAGEIALLDGHHGDGPGRILQPVAPHDPAGGRLNSPQAWDWRASPRAERTARASHCRRARRAIRSTCRSARRAVATRVPGRRGCHRLARRSRGARGRHARQRPRPRATAPAAISMVFSWPLPASTTTSPGAPARRPRDGLAAVGDEQQVVAATRPARSAPSAIASRIAHRGPRSAGPRR